MNDDFGIAKSYTLSKVIATIGQMSESFFVNISSIVLKINICATCNDEKQVCLTLNYLKLFKNRRYLTGEASNTESMSSKIISIFFSIA